MKSWFWHSDSDWVVNIVSPRNSRRLASLSLALSALGQSHQMALSLRKKLSADYILKHALYQPSCSITFRNGKSANLLITDSKELTTIRHNNARKTVKISFTDGKELHRGHGPQFFFPLLFHPKLISTDIYETADRLANRRNRPVRLMFAGNCDAISYSRTQPDSLYTRHEIFEAAKSLPPDLVVFPASAAEFQDIISSGLGKQRLVWIDTNRFRIPQEQWLDYLSQAEYFLCPPGARYPYCHNLNEAMACGTVPILQHGSYYTPALTDDVNSIHLSRPMELRRIVTILLDASGDDWLRQSVAARNYHQCHLSLKALTDTIDTFANHPHELVLELMMAGNTNNRPRCP